MSCAQCQHWSHIDGGIGRCRPWSGLPAGPTIVRTDEYDTCAMDTSRFSDDEEKADE